MRLNPGTRLAGYEVVGPLGAGGMGEVYRARDLRLGRDVAIKVLPEEVASSPARLARFEREARTVAALNHPSIVTLFSIEDADGVRFLTMELVEGPGLESLVAPGGLPLPRVLDLSIQLADALVAAHARGVVHRDLKPGNVMVTTEGRLKVLDFGLAKIEERAAESGATRTGPAGPEVSLEGQVLGTVPYMAPEQIRGRPADPRADVFALGIIMYELTAGRRPFTGATPADVATSILRDRPRPLAEARPDLPAEFDVIVARCLEKEPAGRFPSALEARDALRDLDRTVKKGRLPSPGPRAIASIAVLPFANRGNDEDDEYFSDGLADELLDILSKIRGLRVAARSSSFQFKDSRDDLTSVGRKLNVATLLEGSVRRSGTRARISVQLVNAADGFMLWSETYDRTLDDIFAVQDDIARSVVRELRATLLGEAPDPAAPGEVSAEVARAARGRAQSVEAHRLYLQGRYFADRLTREDTDRGIHYLRQAVEIEPSFALAWAVMALAYTRQANAGWAPIPEAVALAHGAAERALAAEPDLAEAHAVMGWLQLLYESKFQDAAMSISRAVELAPGSVAVCRIGAETARNLGRYGEAVDLARRAVAQDPLSGTSYNLLGLAFNAAGLYPEAEPAFRKALELTPDRVGTHSGLALTYLGLGRGEQALAEAMREPDEGYRLWVSSIVQHALGRREESDRSLATLTDKYANDAAYQIAEVHAARGERDAAFAWLDRAYAQRDGGLITELKSSRYLAPLADDPRWGALLRKVGFES